MAESILITGGAASGKARFAVTSFAAFDNVLYLRAGEELDPDIIHRIEYSTRKNNVAWEVVKLVGAEPASQVGNHKFVIFDSISAYTRLVMREMCVGDPEVPNEITEELKKQVEKRVIVDLLSLRDRIAEKHGSIIIITIETGFSIRPANPAMAAYREILGRVNQRIANSCDEAYFSASGIQFKIR